MDTLHEQFTKHLDGLMKARGLSVNKLADFAGIGRGRMSEILAGKSSPTLRTLGRIAAALEIPVRELLPPP